MDSRDLPRFQEIVTHLFLHYPGSTMPLAELLPDYFTDLKHLTLEQFQVVCVVARRRCLFFPNIAELLQIADAAFASPALLTPRNQAMEAWNAVRRTTGSRAYHEEALTDPITHHCVQAMGGREGFGTWDYDRDEARMRQYFCDLYQTYLLRGAQNVSHEEAERLLKQYGFSDLSGGNWLSEHPREDDDDELTPRD